MISEFVDAMNGKVERYVIDEMERTTPEEVGLDRRSADCLYITKDGVAVDKHSDRSLQYYGGFEYVDKFCRVEMGDYVFYTAESNRVYECIDRFYSLETA